MKGQSHVLEEQAKKRDALGIFNSKNTRFYDTLCVSHSGKSFLTSCAEKNQSEKHKINLLRIVSRGFARIRWSTEVQFEKRKHDILSFL